MALTSPTQTLPQQPHEGSRVTVVFQRVYFVLVSVSSTNHVFLAAVFAGAPLSHDAPAPIHQGKARRCDFWKGPCAAMCAASCSCPAGPAVNRTGVSVTTRRLLHRQVFPHLKQVVDVRSPDIRKGGASTPGCLVSSLVVAALKNACLLASQHQRGQTSKLCFPHHRRRHSW